MCNVTIVIFKCQQLVNPDFIKSSGKECRYFPWVLQGFYLKCQTQERMKAAQVGLTSRSERKYLIL